MRHPIYPKHRRNNKMLIRRCQLGGSWFTYFINKKARYIYMQTLNYIFNVI